MPDVATCISYPVQFDESGVGSYDSKWPRLPTPDKGAGTLHDREKGVNELKGKSPLRLLYIDPGVLIDICD